jgi:VCBS repeat protein
MSNEWNGGAFRLSARAVMFILICFGVLQSTQGDRIAESRADQATDVQAITRPPAFNRQLLLESKSETSANVSIGDLNGDGNLDIVLVKGRHWPLISRVLLGDGKGHFPTAYDLGDDACRSYSGRLIDIDGDGHQDVVLSNDTPDAKLIYLNDGKGHFRRGSTYGRPEWETRNVSVADLNGDDLPDIIVANRADNPKKASNYICLNRGAGRFDADCIAFAPYPATTITVADFNRDGHIDLAVPHRDGGQSYVYIAGPNSSYSESRRIPFGPADAHIRMAEAEDFNGDGYQDIVAIDDTGKTVTVYFAKPDGTFDSGLTVGDRNVVPYALVVADLNRDRKIDIVVGYVEAQPAIYFNDGSGHNFKPLRFGDNKGTAYGFAVADLDQDGVLDIAIARSEAPNVVYFGSR